jgi:hypothetical protein
MFLLLNILSNILWRAEEEERRGRAEAYNGLHYIESDYNNEYRDLYL